MRTLSVYLITTTKRRSGLLLLLLLLLLLVLLLVREIEVVAHIRPGTNDIFASQAMIRTIFYGGEDRGSDFRG